MAWPATPLTTYISGTTPWIKAADMNAIQSGVNGIINGGYSLKGATIDGTGGSAVTTPAGSLTISGANGGALTWPTSPYVQGVLFRDVVTLGWARAYWDGSAMQLYQGYNVRQLTRNGVGNYTVIFQPVVANPARAGVVTSCGQNPVALTNGFVCNVQQISSDGAGRIQVVVRTLDPQGGGQAREAGPDLANWFYVEVKGS